MQSVPSETNCAKVVCHILFDNAYETDFPLKAE